MNSALSRRAKRALTHFVLLTLSASPAYAAAALPGSGSVLDSVKPPAIQQPAAPAPEIRVKDQTPALVGGGELITVKTFRIDGQPPLPAAELLALLEGEAGKDLTLGQLNSLADKLTQYLREKGFLVAFAYLPAQDVKDGSVVIAVVPGQYGQIRISGNAHIDKERLQGMLFTANPGNIITRTELERMLLVINDVAGISVKATLTPGVTSGTADLVLETADQAGTTGVFYADNWGNRYTGQQRYGVQLTINNPGNTGDSLNLGGLTSGNGLNNYNLGYTVLVGNDGSKFSLKHSHVGYTLGKSYASLDATGRAIVTDFDLSHPLVRSRNFSLYGGIGYQTKHLLDDTTSSHTPKHSNLWNLSLSGNSADNWLGGGSNAFSLTHSLGGLYINDSTYVDTAGTEGHFSKTVITYQRQQYLQDNLTFLFNFTGQTAGNNLDSSEKLFLGGADGVRAYPQGETSADEGYKLTGEIRWRMPGLSNTVSNVYLSGFYDYGRAVINKDASWSTDDNRKSLAGTGLGILWTKDKEFSIRLDYAWKNGDNAATSDTDKSGRVWLQGAMYF